MKKKGEHHAQPKKSATAKQPSQKTTNTVVWEPANQSSKEEKETELLAEIDKFKKKPVKKKGKKKSIKKKIKNK